MLQLLKKSGEFTWKLDILRFDKSYPQCTIPLRHVLDKNYPSPLVPWLLGPRLWLGAGAGSRTDLQNDTHNVGGLSIGVMKEHPLSQDITILTRHAGTHN